jgi:cytochrome c
MLRTQTFIVLGTLAALAAPAATASEEIAKKAGCSMCHLADKKSVGPSYKEIAAKYKGKADAVALASEKVRKGSSGEWGPVAMPPTDASRLNDADLKAVVQWILKL